MREPIIATDEQIQRVAKGEAVELVPAKEGHQILLEETDGVITAEHVPVPDTKSPLNRKGDHE